MLADALQVAAMPQVGIGAVALVAVHRDKLVVLHRPRGETIGHQLVEHIGAGKTDALLAALLALLQLITDSLSVNPQHHLARLRLGHIQIDQQIIGAIQANERVEGNTRIVHRDTSVAHILSINHQLQRGILHAHIPVRGLNAIHLDRPLCNHSHTQQNE